MSRIVSRPIRQKLPGTRPTAPLPVNREHQAIQPTADAEETHTVAFHQKTAFIRDCGGERQ